MYTIFIQTFEKKNRELRFTSNCLLDSGGQKGVSESEFLPQFSHQLFLSQKGRCWPRSFVCVVPETGQLLPFPDEIGKTRKIQLKLPDDAFITKTFKRWLYFQLGLPSTKGLGTFHDRRQDEIEDIKPGHPELARWTWTSHCNCAGLRIVVGEDKKMGSYLQICSF